MAKKAVLQIAKTDEDLREVDSRGMALDSLRFLPKVYLVKKLQPDIPEGSVAGKYEYTHNRGYPPMYLYYDEQNRFQQNQYSDITFNPTRFIWGSYSRFASVNNTKFNDDAGGSTNRYLILMSNPLLAPAIAPSPTGHPDPRLKIGDDLESDPDYEASIDSKYQTLKVHMQGQFVCNLPQWYSVEAYGEGWTVKYDWFSFNHNLGYPPVYTPFGITTTGLNIDLAYAGSIPSDFLVNDVNDVMAERWAYDFGWSGDHMEGLWVYVDNTKYYVGYRRQNWDLGNGYTFPARTVRVNYTIFNLPINEEFNLLS